MPDRSLQRIRPRRASSYRYALALLGVLAAALPAFAGAAQPLSSQDILDASAATDWRAPRPENTLYMELPEGRVVIELAPAFAPLHAANLLTLVRQNYFDGLAILRVQDNFVTQWGDPNAEDAKKARSLGKAKRTLAAEFERSSEGLAFDALQDGDVYAPQTGFSDGFPAARDIQSGKSWLAHCYGMIGAGRDNEPESGSGAELYVVIGQAPRQLDRNIALVGRVIDGMPLLSALPRGEGPMGFYPSAAQHVPIRSIRVAADVPLEQHSSIEILRTDTGTFKRWVESRRNRRDAWYLSPAGKIDVCNVATPVRTIRPQRDR